MKCIGRKILATVGVLLVATLTVAAQLEPSSGLGDDRQIVERSPLEDFRGSGDLTSQRDHVWNVFAQLTRTAAGENRPGFESWYGEDQVFERDSFTEGPPRGIRGFSRRDPDGTQPSEDERNLQIADVPVLTYTLYNDAAYRHIRSNRLNSISVLEKLRTTGPQDSVIAAGRSIPPFPTQAIVMKTVWWPIAQDAITALPVWDAESNAPRRDGNSYLSWRRVVAIDSLKHAAQVTTADVQFAGREFPGVSRFGLDAFYHVVVDARLAEHLMRDREARKTTFIALGRALKAGDYIALVGANVATREIRDWIWAAFWWHDRADHGPFAAGRPDELRSQWQNYLMQVAFDSSAPAEADGAAHICFNPWLEGRFPDGGNGGGTSSNCLACHQRASYPAVNFLPVTRGAPDFANDPAYAPGKLRTAFLWSIALHARP